MISLNMIVGPFYEPFLEAAVRSVRGLCDEFIIIDTSPDNQPNSEVLGNLSSIINRPEARTEVIAMPRGEDREFSFSAARELARTNSTQQWVLRLDADEVIHEDNVFELRELCRGKGYDSIEVSFYHFMIYPWLYQYIEPKVILMRKNSFTWAGDVHEHSTKIGNVLSATDIHYYHYGYCRGQTEVFKRWQLYVDIDGKPDWYKGQDPEHIIDDRIHVCSNFEGGHPMAVMSTLTEMFGDVTPFLVREIPRYSMSEGYAGLCIEYNGEGWVLGAIQSAKEFGGHPIVVCTVAPEETEISSLLSLREDLYGSNIVDFTIVHSRNGIRDGILSLMSRQECEYLLFVKDRESLQRGEARELIASTIYGPGVGVSYTNRCYCIRRGVFLKVGIPGRIDDEFLGKSVRNDFCISNQD